MKKQKLPEPVAVDGAVPAAGGPGPLHTTSQPRLLVSEVELQDGRYELAYSWETKAEHA